MGNVGIQIGKLDDYKQKIRDKIVEEKKHPDLGFRGSELGLRASD